MIRAFLNYQKISDPTVAKETEESPNGFDGNGIAFKAKLIGMEDLTVQDNEQECLEAFNRLKASVRVHGEHKQKVQMNLGVNGIQLIDELTQVELVRHEIRRIPYVIVDPRDVRALGYVYNTTDGRHQFWAIKTDRFAQTIAYALKDLFDVVYKVNEDPTETREQDQMTSTNVSVDQMTNTSDRSFNDLFSPFEQPSANSSAASTSLFDDTWGGNAVTTPTQSSKQVSTGNTDPWGFTEPDPVVKTPPPRVESPVNIVALPPPPPSLSRRQTVTQPPASIPPATAMNDNVAIEPIQETFTENTSSASTLFDAFGDIPSTTTDDSFFSPPSAGDLFE